MKAALRGRDCAEQVQMLSPEGRGDTPPDVHGAAAVGIATGGGALPYAAQIQRSFGGYDISHVQAHTSAQAQASASWMRSLKCISRQTDHLSLPTSTASSGRAWAMIAPLLLWLGLSACGAPAPRAEHLDVPIPGSASSAAVAIAVNDFIVATPMSLRQCVYDRLTFRAPDEHPRVERLAIVTDGCGAIAGIDGMLFVIHRVERGARTIVSRAVLQDPPNNDLPESLEEVGPGPEAYPGVLVALDRDTLWHLGQRVQQSGDGGRAWLDVTPRDYRSSLFKGASPSTPSVTWLASGDLFRIERAGAVPVDVGGRRIIGLHGALLTAELEGGGMLGRIEGDSIVWETLDPGWGRPIHAWQVGETTRLLTRTDVRGLGDVADGPVYRVRQGAGGQWRDVSLSWAGLRAGNPLAVDPVGNALVPSVRGGVWYLPASDRTD